MKKILKNILLCIACVLGLISLGINVLETKTTVETKQSSYTLTDFDYVIISPSKEQVADFKSNTEAVNTIFPCYSFAATLNGISKSTMTLFLSDEMEYYSTGLFNNSTLVAGTYNENGMNLDVTAADALGVSVGDQVSVTLAYRNFDFTVTSIYMASTYSGLDKGLALAKYSDEIANAFAKELSYDYAFIDANDLTKCAALLNDYKPLGRLQSEEEYIKEYKEENNCPPWLSEEEWEATIVNAYNEYKEKYLSQDFKNSVQVKSEYMEDVADQVSTTVEKINYICVGVAVGALIVYTILSIVFVYLNKNTDKILLKDGKKDVMKPYYLVAIIGTVLISVCTGGAMYIYGYSSQFFDTYIKIIMAFSLPTLLSIIFIVPFIYKYSNVLTAEVRKEKEKEKNEQLKKVGR